VLGFDTVGGTSVLPEKNFRGEEHSAPFGSSGESTR
jgi:hypothetical protein